MSRSPTPPPPFPLYLLPNIPFFHPNRRSSSHSTNTSSPSNSPPTQPTSYLSPTTTSHLRCYKCLTDLAPTSAIISKGFTGRHGRAYLVAAPSPIPSVLHPGYTARMPRNLRLDESESSGQGRIGENGLTIGELPNTLSHKPVARQLVTGAHTVSDISCRQCGSVLGWKYVGAEEESQRYKIGKFILETKRVVRGAGWENMGDDVGDFEIEDGLSGRTGRKRRDSAMAGDNDDQNIEFDSQDEDECEDLFAGIWSPTLARRRRRRKLGQDDDDLDC